MRVETALTIAIVLLLAAIAWLQVGNAAVPCGGVCSAGEIEALSEGARP